MKSPLEQSDEQRLLEAQWAKETDGEETLWSNQEARAEEQDRIAELLWERDHPFER